MALSILKDQPSKENEQLRQWAIAVLDENSPVPIPSPLKSQLATTKGLDLFLGFKSDLKFEETVECKAVPNPQTLEWLLANYPSQFTRCPNGEVGEKVLNFGKYLQQVKRPASAASSN